MKYLMSLFNFDITFAAVHLEGKETEEKKEIWEFSRIISS